MFRSGIATELPLTEMSTDALECHLLDAQARIDHARSEQLAVVAELDRRRVHGGDGYRTMREWVAAELDESPEVARTLVRTARTVTPEVAELLEAGEMGYARAVETTRLAETGVDDPIGESWRHDIGSLRRRVAARHPLTESGEKDAWDSRYLVVQPNLDQSIYKLHGRLAGYEGHVVTTALAARADTFERGHSTVAQRHADALVSISLDSLTGTSGHGPDAATPLITLFVNTEDAVPSGGERGMVLEGGPRVGRQTLEAIMCEATTEVIALDGAGTVIDLGGESPIPPRVRRTVLARDGGRCTVRGCDSQQRIEVHHLMPRCDGGDHELENLVTLCWFHHHVAIHRNGFVLDPDSPPFARRLVRPRANGPPV